VETLADDLYLVVRWLHGGASVGIRLRATFAPRSLFTVLGAVLRGEPRAAPIAP
jgi:hypothetical protein